MGGHALADGLTERKQPAEYEQIKQAVLDKFTHPNAPVAVYPLQEMAGKESYGDLDLLCVPCAGSTREQLLSFLKTQFHATEIKAVPDIVSFDFQRFQVDLIHCTAQTLPMHRLMLSYGDRGMILGQMAHSRGLCLSLHGLALKLPDLAYSPWTAHELQRAAAVNNSHLPLQGVLSLCTDPDEIRAYMGVPPASEDSTLLASQEGLMDWLRASPCFSPLQFLQRFTNREHRKSCSSRPFYRKFVTRVLQDVMNEHGYPSQELEGAAHVEELFFAAASPTMRQSDEQSAALISWLQALCNDEAKAKKVDKGLHQQEALLRFSAGDALQEAKDKVLKKIEASYKFNGRMLLDLGVQATSINACKLSFLQWLQKEQGQQLEMMQEAEDALLTETKESVLVKLQAWYQEQHSSSASS